MLESDYKGKWNHWAFTRDSDRRVNIYLNGSLCDCSSNTTCGARDTTSRAKIGTVKKFRIGDYVNCSGKPCGYIGKLDEIRIYNYALTATDVSNLYNEEE